MNSRPLKSDLETQDRQRLAELRRLEILDTQDDEAFDRLTRLASRLLDAPVSLVTLIDHNRQFFKSSYGLPEPLQAARQTPLTHSFCKLVVDDCAPLIVNDARNNQRVKNNPAIEELGVQAYAGYPIAMRDGTVIGSFCVIDKKPRTWSEEEQMTLADLTQTVISEFQLRKALLQASRTNAILSRTASGLRNRTEQLQIQDRNKDVFLAELTHELRNPLSPICSGLELLKMGTLASDQVEVVQMIANQTEQLRGLIDDLTEVSMIGRGKLRIEMERVDLHSVTEIAIESVRKTIATKKQILVEPKSGPPVIVRGDKTRLIQIVVNLLTNASRYTPEHGTIRVELRQAGDWAELKVRDDGIGIAIERLNQVFQLYKQLNDETGSIYKDVGLGLGLNLVQRLVELHGGEVTANSDGLGKGSCFTVKFKICADELQLLPALPLVDASLIAVDQLKETIATYESNIVGQHAIIVTKDPQLEDRLFRTLRQLKIIPIAVESLEEGVFHLMDTRSDIMLLDEAIITKDGIASLQDYLHSPDINALKLVALHRDEKIASIESQDHLALVAATLLRFPFSVVELSNLFSASKQ